MGILKKVSLVESFYNPLDTSVKSIFFEIWSEQTGKPRSTFYKRLKKPNLFDYGLITYFLNIDNEFTHIKEHFGFKDKGVKTINDFITTII